MRWIAGLLLVCAAVLKAIELLAEPAAAIVSPLGRFSLPILIGVELTVGLVVLSGVYWRALRWFVLLLFSGFAVYSLYLALNGATSCGCFGPVRIHPWWTFFLDLTVVLGLLFSSMQLNRELSVPNDDIRSLRFVAGRQRVIAGAMALAVVTTALLARSIERRTATAEGMSAMTNSLVILEPEKWVGKKLPIAEFIDADLSNGEWLAVLHRHDCTECQEAVPRYEQIASTGQKVALIEIPPYGDSASHGSFCLCCQLKDDHEWFVQTPIEIHLRDGIVTAAKIHGH